MSKRALVWLAMFWLIVLVAVVTGFVVTRLPGYGLAGQNGTVTVSAEEYEMLQRYSRLEEVYEILNDAYYTEPDSDELTLGAVRGMMDSLGDRYTFYYTVEEMQEMQKESTGEYKGIGISYSEDSEGNLVVLHVYRDTPAEEAGILPGDLLLRVNDEDLTDLPSVDSVAKRIELFGDEPFTMTVLRDGEEITVPLYRAAIVANRAEYRLLDGDIGYLALSDFMGDCVEGTKEALKEFGPDIRGLVIDLRDNPGGYLDAVCEIADMLLPKCLVIYTEDRAGNRWEYNSDAKCVQYPIVVLVNGMSASASEVLSGALKDNGAATIIGSTTFGKGIVQCLYTFDDGAGLQLTTARYFTPSGVCIHGIGIEPDCEVEDDPETPEDEALDYALQYLQLLDEKL